MILADSFVRVALTLRTTPCIEIPANGLLMKGERAFVTVLKPGNKVRLRPVTIYESDGKTVRLGSGLG